MFRDLSCEIRAFFRKISRMIFWGWKLRNSYDFDGCYIYQIIYLKLDRMYSNFTDHGRCLWTANPNNKEMRKLKYARELAKRLYDCEYLDNSLIPHEKLFGKHSINFDDNIYSTFSLVSTEKEHKRAEKSLRNYFQKSNKMKQAEHKILFKLLDKYLQQWWD